MYIQRLRTFTAPWARPSVPVKQMGRKVEVEGNPINWPAAWGERGPLPSTGNIPYVSGTPEDAPDQRYVTFGLSTVAGVGGLLTVRVPREPDPAEYDVVEDGPGDSGHYFINRLGIDAVVTAENGVMGRTRKLWSPEGRFMPQVEGDGWRTNWRTTAFDPSGELNISNNIPGSVGVDAGPLGFKRTFRARLGGTPLPESDTVSSNSLTFNYTSGTVSTGHPDWRLGSRWSGIRSPGYEEVEHSFSACDTSNRVYAVYLDDQSTDDWWTFIDAIYSEVFESDNEGIYYDMVEFALPEPDRRQYRCIVTDGEDNTVITAHGWLAIGDGFTMNSSIATVPPQDTTVIGGEAAHFAAQFQGIFLVPYTTGASSYDVCRWETRASPADAWVIIEDADRPVLEYPTTPGQWIDDVWYPSPDDGRQFRCQRLRFNLTNADSAPTGIITLGIATLTVIGEHEAGPLSISTQHGDRIYRLYSEIGAEGGGGQIITPVQGFEVFAPMVLACNAVGQGLSYQWQTRDDSTAAWEDIPGATTGVYHKLAGDFDPEEDPPSRSIYGKGVYGEYWGSVILFEHRGPNFFDPYWWWFDDWEGFPWWLEPELLETDPWMTNPYNSYADWPPFDDPLSLPNIAQYPSFTPFPEFDPEDEFYDPEWDTSLEWGGAPVAGVDYNGWLGTWAYDDDNPPWPPPWGEAIATTNLAATPIELTGVANVLSDVNFSNGDVSVFWWSDIITEDVEQRWEDLKAQIEEPYDQSIFYGLSSPADFLQAERAMHARRFYRGSATHPMPLADVGEFKTYFTGGRLAPGDPIDVTQAAFLPRYTQSDYFGWWSLRINGTFGFRFTHRYDIPLPFSTTNLAGDDGVVGGRPS